MAAPVRDFGTDLLVAKVQGQPQAISNIEGIRNVVRETLGRNMIVDEVCLFCRLFAALVADTLDGRVASFPLIITSVPPIRATACTSPSAAVPRM